MSLRQIVFWLHLASGLLTGAVVALMSATGVAIAFEEELLAWRDREVRLASPAKLGAPPLPLAELRERARAAYPDFNVTSITVHRDPLRAHALYAGREGPLYADPVTGALRPSIAGPLHDLIHELEEWHRWLGRHDDGLATGKAITGAANLAFLFLCLSGLWLWWPRHWSRRALRPRLWFVRGLRGRARDYTWHHVLGLWSLPVLVVLAATAVVISYGWAHRLVFTLVGEEAPHSRNFGMMAQPALLVPTPPPDAVRLPLDQVLARVAAHLPDWTEIGVNFPTPADATRSTLVPLEFDVTVPDYMPSRAYVPVEVDPFTGEILRATRFQDRSPGLRARVWARFLHTGAGLGLPGKIIATLATLASLVLVYTGFALSWRRFLRPKSPGASA